MALMEWSEKYCVGNEEIDYQHQRLFTLVNNLHSSLQAGEDMRLLVDVFLNQLVQYTDFHFSTEERLMKSTNYAEYPQHKALHDALRAQVTDFQKRFVKEDANVTDELMKFLSDWLTNHIQKTDTKLSSHLKHAH